MKESTLLSNFAKINKQLAKIEQDLFRINLTQNALIFILTAKGDYEKKGWLLKQIDKLTKKPKGLTSIKEIQKIVNNAVKIMQSYAKK